MINGEEYVKQPQMDAPTFYGMRMAMFETLKHFKENPNEPVTQASVARELRVESYKNEYIRAAGSEEVIARYFENLVKGTTDAKLLEFTNKFDSNKIAAVSKALKENHGLAEALRENAKQYGPNNDGLITALAHGGLEVLELKKFHDALKSCFGMSTMTDSLADYYKNHRAELSDVHVETYGLTKDQANQIADIDYVFRWIDKRMPPEVQQHVHNFDPKDYVGKPLAPAYVPGEELKNASRHAAQNQAAAAARGAAEAGVAYRDGLANAMAPRAGGSRAVSV